MTRTYAEIPMLTDLEDGSSAAIASFQHWGHHRATVTTFGNGATATADYDGFRRKTSIVHEDSGSVEFAGFTYGYDANGNPLSSEIPHVARAGVDRAAFAPARAGGVALTARGLRPRREARSHQSAGHGDVYAYDGANRLTAGGAVSDGAAARSVTQMRPNGPYSVVVAFSVWACLVSCRRDAVSTTVEHLEGELRWIRRAQLEYCAASASRSEPRLGTFHDLCSGPRPYISRSFDPGDGVAVVHRAGAAFGLWRLDRSRSALVPMDAPINARGAVWLTAGWMSAESLQIGPPVIMLSDGSMFRAVRPSRGVAAVEQVLPDIARAMSSDLPEIPAPAGWKLVGR